MKRKKSTLRHLLFISLFLTLCTFRATAQMQSFNEEFIEKLTHYSKANPSKLLFVHTDKNIYTNNENIWFSAYLLSSGLVSLKEHTILSVVLLREDNREIYRQEKFVMEQGIAFGNMELPDSIPPGNYQFVAYTNILDRNKFPAVHFQQALTIKSITQTDFSVQVSLLDSTLDKGSVRVKVQVEIKDPDLRRQTRPIINYTVGKIRFSARVDSRNTCILTIPKEGLTGEKPLLLASIKYKNEVQHVSIPLPGVNGGSPIQIRFSPEGGDLVDGLESKVGWESRTANGLSTAVKGVLYENDQAIDTLSTSSYGIGTFSLKPNNGKRYSLRLLGEDNKRQEQIYKLPQALADGVVLNLKESVVNDTLQLYLSSKKNGKIQVLIHDYLDGYASFPMQVSPEVSTKKIVLTIVPKGLATITVIDEAGRPLGERLFFAHHDQQLTTTFQLEKDSYEKRENVQLKLKLMDSSGNKTDGIVSVACVQDNRIDSDKQIDIENYARLNSQLNHFPADPSGKGLRNKGYLENILLVRGWRRYTWQGLMKVTASDTVKKSESPLIWGQVFFEDKRLKKAVKVHLLKMGGQFETIETKNNGDIHFKREDLTVKEGHKILASVDSKNKEKYTVQIQDPYPAINRLVAEQLTINNVGIVTEGASTKQFELSGLENGTTLKEVLVKARHDSSIFGTKPKGSNACGDYVDANNYLNSPGAANSPHLTPPIEGQTYIDGTRRIDLSTNQIISYQENSGGAFRVITVVYKGCTTEPKGFTKLDGIYTTREFFGFNEQLKDFPDPQLLSTLYWKPGVVINEHGEIDFSFFTGDIAGKFRLVVQGVGSKDLIYGEKTFEVK